MNQLPPPIGEQLLELLALQVFSKTNTQNYIDWAVKSLSLGLDSPSLCRLAGLYTNDDLYFETKPLFNTCLKELSIQTPAEELIIKRYIELIMEQTTRRKRNPYESLNILATLYVSGNNDQLSWFSDLQEASELYESEIGTYHYLYPDLEDLDLERCIIEECKLYLGFQAVQCEPHRFQDIYCKDCNQWGLPLPKRPIAGLIKRMIGFFGKHQEKNTNKQCQNCGSKDLLEIYSLESRLQYLEYLRKKS